MLLNSFKTPPYLITASVTPPSYTQNFRGEPSPFITIFALIVNQHPAVELPAANNYRHCTLIASEVSAIAKNKRRIDQVELRLLSQFVSKNRGGSNRWQYGHLPGPPGGDFRCEVRVRSTLLFVCRSIVQNDARARVCVR